MGKSSIEDASTLQLQDKECRVKKTKGVKDQSFGQSALQLFKAEYMRRGKLKVSEIVNEQIRDKWNSMSLEERQPYEMRSEASKDADLF